MGVRSEKFRSVNNFEQVTLWELPCKSQECIEGPLLTIGSETASLSFDYETDAGEYNWLFRDPG